MQNLSVHYSLKKVKLQSFLLLKLLTTEGKTMLLLAYTGNKKPEKSVRKSIGRRIPHLTVCL